MELGLALPQYDYQGGVRAPLPWATVVEWARRADRLGLHSLWMADHLFLPLGRYLDPDRRPGDTPPTETFFGYDPLVALAGLARVTTRARLGSLVLCAPLRPAGLVARQLATLDELASGRLIAGLGAGWNEPEFTAASVPFGPPGRRLAQLVEVIETLRRSLPAAGPGREAPVPLWVGGRGDRLIEVAANHADGWNTVWTWTPAAYRERSETLDRACTAAGRDPASVTRSLGLFTLVGESQADLERRFERLRRRTVPGVVGRMSLAEWRTGHLVGTVEEVREQKAQWEALGVSLFIAGLGAVPFSTTDPDDLDLLASAIL